MQGGGGGDAHNHMRSASDPHPGHSGLLCRIHPVPTLALVPTPRPPSRSLYAGTTACTQSEGEGRGLLSWEQRAGGRVGCGRWEEQGREWCFGVRGSGEGGGVLGEANRRKSQKATIFDTNSKEPYNPTILMKKVCESTLGESLRFSRSQPSGQRHQNNTHDTELHVCVCE